MSYDKTIPSRHTPATKTRRQMAQRDKRRSQKKCGNRSRNQQRNRR